MTDDRTACEPLSSYNLVFNPDARSHVEFKADRPISWLVGQLLGGQCTVFRLTNFSAGSVESTQASGEVDGPWFTPQPPSTESPADFRRSAGLGTRRQRETKRCEVARLEPRRVSQETVSSKTNTSSHGFRFVRWHSVCQKPEVW